MELNTQEIIDLAQFAGLTVTTDGLSFDDEDHIIRVHKKIGGFVVEDDDGRPERYATVATCDGCDANEVQPLGKPIDS